MAFLVLLEALSPVERAVFMLREVFGYGYPDVARITGKTEVNCRQIFARARQRIAAGVQAPGSAPPPARRAEGEEFARRFFEAAAGGDMDALLGMLAPDVTVHGDGGGKAQAARKPLAGRQQVTRHLVGLFRRGRVLGVSLRLAWVNGQPGAVRTTPKGAWSACSRSTSPTAWSRQSAPWSIPTSLATSDRCLIWRDCRRTKVRAGGNR